MNPSGSLDFEFLGKAIFLNINELKNCMSQILDGTPGASCEYSALWLVRSGVTCTESCSIPTVKMGEFLTSIMRILGLKCLSSMQKCDLVLANQLGHKHTSPRNLPIPIKRFASTPQHPQNPFVEEIYVFLIGNSLLLGLLSIIQLFVEDTRANE